MSLIRARRWLPMLVVMGCMIALTAAALACIRHFDIGLRFWWVPMGLALVSGTLLVRFLLLAVEDWLDRMDRDIPGRRS